jgi:hypothetical protein
MPAGARTYQAVSTAAIGVLVALSMASAASGQVSSVDGPSYRLRPSNRAARDLLSAGIARSAAFRAIVTELERSDLVVYVEARSMSLPGAFQLVAVTPGCRYVRVSVRTPGLPNEQVAWLAHELWHAAEVARAPDVVGQASLRRFYERVGDGGRHSDRAESPAAQAAWVRVLGEMRAGK